MNYDEARSRQVESSIKLSKISFSMPISEEMLPGYVNPRPGHFEPPTSEEMAAFYKWQARFKFLRIQGRKHGWFRDGGPDYDFQYTPPEERWVWDDPAPEK